MIDSDVPNQRTSAAEAPAPGCEQLVEPFTSIISTEEGVNDERQKAERIRQEF
jgi:hypothetical protein